MNARWLWIMPLFILLASCSREDEVQPPIDESYWLQQERGIVVASDFGCDYFIVQTARGHALLRNWGGFSPLTGATLYGNFSRWGIASFYNRSEGYVGSADVRDYWMSYFEAWDAYQWSCGSGIPFRQSGDSARQTPETPLPGTAVPDSLP